MADEQDRQNKGTSENLRRQMAKYRVVPDLLRALEGRATEETEHVIIELSIDYPGGLRAARKDALELLDRIGVSQARIVDSEDVYSQHNLFAQLTLAELIALDAPLGHYANGVTGPHPVYKVWADHELQPFAAFTSTSIRTIKAEACLTTFGADGKDIIVAVADSGIDGAHAHFALHANLRLPQGITHRDFTPGNEKARDDAALVDPYGHGTHVAGTIAGEYRGEPGRIARLRTWQDARRFAGGADAAAELTAVQDVNEETSTLRGVAPKAQLLSLRVLDDKGAGRVSRLIAALDYLYELNDSGRKLKVHVLNLSLGYPFDAEWYAAGQSPLCVIVNRLVRSGMAVVVAAGNHGSVKLQGMSDNRNFTVDQTINDPGNAQEAITVGSTHGESPHLYGVSYFSSRGPTADGRVKPDLLAPGERILSCATGSLKAKALDDAHEDDTGARVYYREDSGTSMAAAHVSGAVAAFLSIQREFINEPQRVKTVLMGSCTDLGRKRDFQGAGLIDLMRAVQSV